MAEGQLAEKQLDEERSTSGPPPLVAITLKFIMENSKSWKKYLKDFFGTTSISYNYDSYHERLIWIKLPNSDKIYFYHTWAIKWDLGETRCPKFKCVYESVDGRLIHCDEIFSAMTLQEAKDLCELESQKRHYKISVKEETPLVKYVRSYNTQSSLYYSSFFN